jgi:transglutaminase-like putative cysteine protease
MTIRVALNHRTSYDYDKLISVNPQMVRLRPAPHCRTPILSYSLKVEPAEHFCNWQQDPHGNFIGRFVFPKKTPRLSVTVDLGAGKTGQSIRFLHRRLGGKFPVQV